MAKKKNKESSRLMISDQTEAEELSRDMGDQEMLIASDEEK